MTEKLEIHLGHYFRTLTSDRRWRRDGRMLVMITGNNCIMFRYRARRLFAYLLLPFFNWKTFPRHILLSTVLLGPLVLKYLAMVPEGLQTMGMLY